MATATVMPTFPTMMPTMVNKKRIVSICPLARRKTIPIGGMLFPFQIPAQPRGKYHILEVADTYTMIRTGFREDTEEGVRLSPAPIPAHVLANDLVREWNMSFANVGSLGLRVLPDDVQEGTPEFGAIIAELTAQLREVAEWAIRQANDLYGKNKSEFITNGFHRELARWLLSEEAVRSIPWYNAQAINELKACIACGTSIDAVAKVCKSCGTDLIKYFIEYNLEDSADPIVAASVKRVKTPKAETGTTAETGAPPAVRVNLGGAKMPGDARAACVNALNGEQKAEMTQRSGQDARDEYLISLIPELCLKNPTLRDTLKAKGYVAEV